jgi:Rab proteins geranylgeranyltransferase component A
MMRTEYSKSVLEEAVSHLLNFLEKGKAKLLYSLYYEQEQQASTTDPTIPSDASLDLAFNDEGLQAVEDQWKIIMADENEVVDTTFMQFEDREGMNNDDDDGDEGF